jgi:hypothetical protein
MDLVKLQVNTIPTIQKWLQEQGYYVSTRWNKTQLIEKVNEHFTYHRTKYKFDKLDKVILHHFSRCVEPMLVIRFANTCKRFRTLMNTNFTWHRICQSMDKYADIHELDLQRVQPEGFWREWYLQNCLRVVKRCPSYYANREVRGGAIISTIYPNTGSILVDRLMLAHPRFVCVEVTLLARGGNKNLPKVVKIAPLVEQNSDSTLHYYRQSEVITMKIGEAGEIDDRYTVVIPESYARPDLGLV